MQIYENISLAEHSTMRLGGEASYLTIIDDAEDLTEVVAWAKKYNQPILVIGEGSNIIFRDSGWDGLVIVMKIPGYKVIAESKTEAIIRIGGGELWDGVVKRAADAGLSGIEALSLIPGTTGAAPVQNIGAYGQEIADTLTELEVFDCESQSIKTMTDKDCKFGYRDSIFKDPKRKNLIITSVTLRLSKQRMQPPFYASLQKHFNATGATTYAPGTIRDAVIAIRNQKLPDPRAISNTGSFFKNPIIAAKAYSALKKTYPELPGYQVDKKTTKIPAGWLIERAGFKDYRHDNGMGTYEKHSLVFVNYHAKGYRDLAEFKKQVQDKVQSMFGINLEQEPETI